MRPSEFGTTKAPPTRAKPKYRTSERAEPPITEAETRSAPVSVCRFHDGLVRLTGDTPGRVFFCPIGNQYWRYAKPKQWRTLALPSKGYV